MKQLQYGACVAALAALSSGTGAFAASSQADSPRVSGWHLTPHMEVMETYTDNVDLQPINKKNDFVTRLSPGAHLVGVGARINLDVDYTANYLYFAKSANKSDWRHDLSAKMSTELVKELFFLDAGASINQQFIDPGAALSGNFDNRTDNRKTVQNYLLSPSLRHAFGTFGVGTARYSLNYIRTNADKNQLLFDQFPVLENSTSHDFGLGFESGRQFPRLEWGADVDYQLRTRQANVGDYKRTNLRAHAAYPVTHWLSLVGSAGYEKINEQSLSGRTNGFVWDAGVTLKPGPRTTLSVRGGKRYGETNFSVDGQYLVSTRTRLTVGYHDTITNSGDILARQLGGNIQFPAAGQSGSGNTFAATPGDPGGFGLINRSFRRKRAEVGIAGSRGRNSLELGGYYETRDIDNISAQREKNWGGSAGFSRAIGPHLSASVGGNYQRSEFVSQLDRIDHIYTAQAGLNYIISKDLSGGVQYFLTHRNSNQAQYELRENAVRISLRATF